MYKIRLFLKDLLAKLDRRLYHPDEFVVISNNCWGAEIYKRLGLRYNTPFVGLFIFGPDYLELLTNLEHYLHSQLTFSKKSKWLKKTPSYPIGNLDGIEIHFVHYKDEAEAFSKWNRRVDRMKKVSNQDRYFVKICDRDQVDTQLITKFHDLPFKHKISFGIQELDQPGYYQITENDHHQTVPDGVFLYRYAFKYIDLLQWISTEKQTQNYYSKIKAIVGVA